MESDGDSKDTDDAVHGFVFPPDCAWAFVVMVV